MADTEEFDAFTAALRILVFDGEMSLLWASSWMVNEHPELERWTPAQWADAGRDVERLLLVARRDAARSAV